ncbi:hypothetical protein QYF61_017941 [Mycteria americana]|uniref:Uncharacterized protein n=1 Tax=Mycteria americana TaxID=33587 RepID=A0AAN7NEX1_MYCAM|nr:hypothetical protein QYF61_017941 [Mycteria americana]
MRGLPKLQSNLQEKKTVEAYTHIYPPQPLPILTLTVQSPTKAPTQGCLDAAELEGRTRTKGSLETPADPVTLETLVRPHLENFVQFWPPQNKRDMAERAGTVQPGAEKAQGDLINVYKHLQRGGIEDRARLLSVVPSGRTRGNRHKPKHRRFPLNIRKHFFTVRMTKHWHRLPREVAEPPSLDILKSHLDMKDIKLLDCVQRSVTKMGKSLKGKTYKEQLRSLGLFSLEKRRLRGDLITVYNFLKGGSGAGC